ncbi:hypothetical protein FSP39_006448 [Pinctada imbricata]|uniref:Dual specificity protein phosphatase n=1 Tax=Pinctada imbricata TaxID=66713 RepID=A0AA88YHI3_PINIB|nr:hypothetical protein FSP39_006448 [Pinctada imbricata]
MAAPDDDGPCTPEDLDTIITAPSGGLTMLPTDGYNEVYPDLLIGDESIAKDRIGLKRIGVTHVLNTAVGKTPYHVNTNHVMYSRLGIQFMGIEAMDTMNFQLHPYFNQCADFIDKALENGGKVLVNCKVGASRSATITLAFLMIKRHMTVKNALRMVRQKREVCPNEGFLQQLCDLNETLRKAGHFTKHTCNSKA